MSIVVVVVVAFLVAYVTSSAAVPPITRLAVTRKLLDFPDGHRHGHARPVPRLGGVAVFAGLVVAVAGAPLVSLILPGSAPTLTPLAGAFVLASLILFAIGLADDLRGVPPLLKLLGQTAAALVLYHAGFKIDVLGFPPSYEMSLGWLSLPVTVLWLVGVSNAFNLIDGLDGLAGGVAVIALLAITAASVILGNLGVLLYSVALIGALLGFLRYNFPPARIFLGDSGSLVVGFLLAVLSVKGATRHGGSLYALMPIFALSYLLLDTGLAMMRRWLRGDPLSRADGRHIHHQLLNIGLNPRRAALVVYAQAIAAAALGLCATFVPPALLVAVGMVGVVLLMFMMVYGVRRLEYHEFVEAQASVASVVRKARSVIQDKINARDMVKVIRSAATIEEVEAIVEDSAMTFRFAHMQLCHGSAEKRLPEHIVARLKASSVWQLQYPIAQRGFAPDALFLNICCGTDASRRPAGAERVAQILAPAIAAWAMTRRMDFPVEVRREIELGHDVEVGHDVEMPLIPPGFFREEMPLYQGTYDREQTLRP